MKDVTLHHVQGAQTNVLVQAVGKVGPGGAYSFYRVNGFDTSRNTANSDDQGYCSSFSNLPVIFQNEKPGEHGLVGITMESLMAICIDRLTDFQAGAFPSEENEEAKGHLEKALEALQRRTKRFVALDAINNAGSIS